MTTSSALKRSIARRALLALLLTIGFYALAFLMMGILLLVPLLEMRTGHLHFQLLLICMIGFLAILVSLLPRRDRFETPWPRITAAEHPRLFEKLEHIAARAKQRMPDEVYLVPELNAWVADRGGRTGGSRRVMGIGLPLLQVLNVSQFTAVIAHEFGHYYGGDTRLGPWIHKTRVTIGRTMDNLAGSSVSIVQAPFHAYGRMFMRVTQGVSREQEYTADRFAASIAGREPVASSLKRLVGYDPGVGMYWNRLLMPVLSRGFRPPITAGMAQMIASEQISNAAASYVENVIQEAKEDPFDTHPCLRDRIAALEGLPAGESEDTTPALSLLDNIRGVEDKVLGMYVHAEKIADLQEIEWTDVAERAFMPAYASLRDANRDILSQWAVEEMPAMFEQAGRVGSEMRDIDGKHVDPEQFLALFLSVVRSALSLALREAGWTMVARPDYGRDFVRGELHVDPGQLIDGLAQKHIDQKGWGELCTEMGINGMLLSGGMAPADREPRRTVTFNPAPRLVREDTGEGATVETAIPIHGTRTKGERTDAEFAWLAAAFGPVRENWTFMDHRTETHNGRHIDKVEIKLKDGRQRFVYFDCTE